MFWVVLLPGLPLLLYILLHAHENSLKPFCLFVYVYICLLLFCFVFLPRQCVCVCGLWLEVGEQGAVWLDLYHLKLGCAFLSKYHTLKLCLIFGACNLNDVERGQNMP